MLSFKETLPLEEVSKGIFVVTSFNSITMAIAVSQKEITHFSLENAKVIKSYIFENIFRVIKKNLEHIGDVEIEITEIVN